MIQIVLGMDGQLYLIHVLWKNGKRWKYLSCDSSSWYADTSTIESDLDGDGKLDDSNLSILGINPSISGEYHLGYPDPSFTIIGRR